MASDTSHPGEEEVKLRRKRREPDMRRKKVSVVDIEELTSAGHRALQDGQTEVALRCFKDALKTAEQLQDSRVLRVCSFNLGAAYVEAGRPQRGLNFLQKAEPGPKADRIPDLQFNLALAHNALGQSREAATYFLQAAHLYRSQGASGSEGDACMEMGHCYTRTRVRTRTQDWSLAIQAFLRAAESYRVAAMLDSAAAALKEAGSYMVQSDQFNRDDITSVLTECLSLTDSIKDPRTLGSLGCRGDQARCFSNLAFAYSQLSEEEEATESFIQALLGFRDTEDHLAQVQVCESLAECYLKQRKQQKAIQLYKEALSALSHCEDDAGRVRDRLVECLTAALQQSLTVSLQRPRLLRPHPHRPHPHNSPVRLHLRKSDITGRVTNQQVDEQKGEGPGADQEATGRREMGRANDRAEYMNVAPGQYSLYQSDQQQHSDLWSDRENPPTDSETSLVQETNVPPTSRDGIIKIPSPMSQWRSRFCSLM